MLARALIASVLVASGLGAQPHALTHFGSPNDGYTQYSGIADSLRITIRDVESWRRYWDEIHRPFRPPPPIPDVDFTREMVVVAAMGTRPTGGFLIVIDSVAMNAAQLLVRVTQVVPGRGCAVPASVTQPVDVVRLPASQLPVSFSERVERTDCGTGSAPDRR